MEFALAMCYKERIGKHSVCFLMGFCTLHLPEAAKYARQSVQNRPAAAATSSGEPGPALLKLLDEPGQGARTAALQWTPLLTGNWP